MRKANAGLIICAVMMAGQFIALPSHAEIQEYQIRRLVLLKSECRIQKITRFEAKGGYDYQVECENVTFYPDGLKVSCSNPELETSCKIQTSSKKFDLEYLKRSVNTEHNSDRDETPPQN